MFAIQIKVECEDRPKEEAIPQVNQTWVERTNVYESPRIFHALKDGNLKKRLKLNKKTNKKLGQKVTRNICTTELNTNNLWNVLFNFFAFIPAKVVWRKMKSWSRKKKSLRLFALLFFGAKSMTSEALLKIESWIFEETKTFEWWVG